MSADPAIDGAPRAPGLARLAGAWALSAKFPVWLCDIWGVLHDGISAYPQTVDALLRHRAGGGLVILLTNAPRTHRAVRRMLARVGVPEQAYDGVLSSGDVTRDLVQKRAGRRIHHLGPRRDLDLLDGLPVAFVPFEEAEAVLLTGLPDDEETVEAYDGLLRQMLERRLDMICANPDLVVRVGGRLYPCAGALAERYASAGGTVEMAGKPHAPIYAEALEMARGLLERPVDRAEVLAIGDGLPTDMRGASNEKLAALFISAGGIHDFEAEGGHDDLAALLRNWAPEARMVGHMERLSW